MKIIQKQLCLQSLGEKPMWRRILSLRRGILSPGLHKADWTQSDYLTENFVAKAASIT